MDRFIDALLSPKTDKIPDAYDWFSPLLGDFGKDPIGVCIIQDLSDQPLIFLGKAKPHHAVITCVDNIITIIKMVKHAQRGTIFAVRLRRSLLRCPRRKNISKPRESCGTGFPFCKSTWRWAASLTIWIYCKPAKVVRRALIGCFFRQMLNCGTNSSAFSVLSLEIPKGMFPL